MAISKEKMESINKDFEKLNANLEGLSEEELKEVAAGTKKNGSLAYVLALAIGATVTCNEGKKE